MNNKKYFEKNYSLFFCIIIIVVGIIFYQASKKIAIPPRADDGCVITGCSGHLCAEEELITTCEFLPKYECFKNTQCERQSDGRCNWTRTPELISCLSQKLSSASRLRNALRLKASSLEIVQSLTSPSIYEVSTPVAMPTPTPAPMPTPTPVAMPTPTSVPITTPTPVVKSTAKSKLVTIESLEARSISTTQRNLLSEGEITPSSAGGDGDGDVFRVEEKDAERNFLKGPTPPGVVGGEPSTVAIPNSFIAITQPNCDVEGEISSLVDDNKAGDLKTMLSSVSCVEIVADNVAFYNALAGIPNDTRFREQWGFNNTGQAPGWVNNIDINAPEAWDITTGNTNVVVGVIDTGLFIHPDGGRLWVNPNEIPNNNRDDDGNGYVDDINGYDFVNGDNNPNEESGHGTLVAGIIGAAGNNSLGISGVSQQVTIAPLKIFTFNSEGIQTSSLVAIIRALNYAIAEDIEITNHSYVSKISRLNPNGSINTTFSLWENAIIAARNAGVLVIAASGNGGDDNIGDNNDSFPSYPASFNQPNVITVTSVTPSGERAGDANFGGSSVHLGAPGTSQLSTAFTGGRPCTLCSATGYRVANGTSFATPHVAGAAALLRSYYPTASIDTIRTAILEGVKPLSSMATITTSGGMLDLMGSLRSLNTPPVANAGPDQSQKVGVAISFNGANSSDREDGTPVSYSWYFGDSSSAGGTIINHTFTKAGTYTVNLIVADKFGIQGNDTAIVTITGPDTTIADKPSNPSTVTNPTFTFTSDTTNATFECQLDTAAFAACTTPKAYTGLKAGNHTFKVRAKTSAGVDATPASYTWTRQ